MATIHRADTVTISICTALAHTVTLTVTLASTTHPPHIARQLTGTAQMGTAQVGTVTRMVALTATHSEGGFNLRTAVLSWLSPRVLLTMSMGVGATGVLLASVLPGEPLRGLASLAGAVALEKLVVSPIWNVLTRFASTPARTLESAVMEEATAVTGFDTSGCGLVSINLDGHEMRLLGRLAAEHRNERVRSGDTLIVESVDGARGQCVVSPISVP